MKILITGAKGFLGKNLMKALTDAGYDELFSYDMDSSREEFEGYCRECDFVFHLAGVNRPKDKSEFISGNKGFTEEVLQELLSSGNKVPVLLSSSIQAGLDNDYGRSKRAAEEAVFSYGRENSVPVYVYRFPNLFGRWSRPNYNTVIATFCYNIARDIPIRIDDREKLLPLSYVDDVTGQFIRILKTGIKLPAGEFVVFPPALIYERRLGYIADRIFAFKDAAFSGREPELKDEFEAKLYETYRSFLPEK
ncbi:MAG: NAD-dependent epimerase/dehydratase family protein [Lachnospiraceae bacterium]|nr:NAD-dependent epimerase/dehydratase family protein [Lachnospiraceae bacterium]